MNLDTLTHDINAGAIDALHLISIEGGFYVLHALSKGRTQPVQDASGATLRVGSAEAARKCLVGIPDVPFFLVHPSAYDEMIGLSSAADSATRLPINLRSIL